MPAESDSSSLRTISDSMIQSLYRYKDNRRFQAISEDYIWPCDSAASRMELRVSLVMEHVYPNKLYFEPEPDALKRVLETTSSDGPSRCLDLASGSTASWCIAMAERFPSVEHIGCDLVPSDLNFLPPNLSTEVVDLREGLPYPDQFFNLVHSRMPGGGLPAFFDSPPPSGPTIDILSEIARVLRPGGIFLLEDLDDLSRPTLSDDPANPYLAPALARHAPRWAAGIRRRPQDYGRPSWGQRMTSLVRETPAFAASTQEATFRIPLGRRDDEADGDMSVGSLNREAWLDSYELEDAGAGMGEAALRRERKKDEEALPERDVGLWVKWRVVWAQKN